MVKIKKRQQLTKLLILNLWFIIVPVLVYAAPTGEQTKETLPFDPKEGAFLTNISTSITGLFELDLGRADPLTITIQIINLVLTFLGAAFLVLLIYAGVLWATARGNQEQVTKAKQLIKRSIIGITIILAALGTAWFIFTIVNDLFVKPS